MYEHRSTQSVIPPMPGAQQQWPSGQWTTPPTPKKKRGKVWLIIGAIVAVFAAIGALTPDKKEATNQSVSEPAAAAEPFKPADDIDVAETPDVDTSWLPDALAMSQEMGATFDSLGTAANDMGIDTVVSLCRQGQSDLPGWRATAESIGIDNARTPMLQALDHYQIAFDECASGTIAGLNVSADEMTTASEYVNESAAALSAFNG